jgi:hypothetical protein
MHMTLWELASQDIGSITVDELQKVSQNLFMRCEACLQAEVVTFNTCYKAR